MSQTPTLEQVMEAIASLKEELRLTRAQQFKWVSVETLAAHLEREPGTISKWKYQQINAGKWAEGIHFSAGRNYLNFPLCSALWIHGEQSQQYLDEYRKALHEAKSRR